MTYIVDWQENNKIRADRKTNSIYKDLLEEIVLDVQTIEPRQRADVLKKTDDVPTMDDQNTSTEQAVDNQGASITQRADVRTASNDEDMDNQWTSSGQPMDNQWTQDGRHRIGKDRIGKDRVGKDRVGQDSSTNTEREADTQGVCADAHTVRARAHTRGGELSTGEEQRTEDGDATSEAARKVRAPSVPYGEIMECYNTICVSLTPIKLMSESRKQAVKGRYLKEFHSDLGEVCAFFRKVEASDFLCGRGNSDWSASFDWLMKPKNTVKVLEGTYDNKKPRAPDIPQMDMAARAIAILEAENDGAGS